ncbi:PTB domain-containing engulfment adapter protein 1 isoform X2 [Bacillus rossius redtenbacheri]|uniref:PTB domain-containing engulfment adapter protein 1 isoform X2 n=1 Tax=Bacillus rossius redtenbacheri TaxID=93214 RepID=UPI002FDD134F
MQRATSGLRAWESAAAARRLRCRQLVWSWTLRRGVSSDMMRNSTLLKWAHNNSNNKQAAKIGNRNWIHPPDALQRGHIAYLVKFLGNTEVDQPKGIEVVKEGIRKLKFNQQLRKAEGSKTPKVELTISIDGVAIQEPKTKQIMHQYPLHRISYCADDKGEKRFFSFIAKEVDSERHMCFVFVSDKLAEEITLTIGQAFDLAYRRFLETSGKDLEAQRRLMLLQQKVKKLETENGVLRQRLTDITDIAQIKSQSDVEEYLARNGISDLLLVTGGATSDSCSSQDLNSTSSSKENGSSSGDNLLIFNNTAASTTTASSNGFASSPAQPPPVPPRAFETGMPFGEENFLSDGPAVQPAVGTKLEGLLLDELEEDFNPRAFERGSSVGAASATNGSTSPTPLLAPPPKVSRDSRRAQYPANGTSSSPFQEDLFGSVPFNPAPPVPSPRSPPAGQLASSDPFGMGTFGAHEGDPSQQELENAIGLLDKKIMEMKDGFSRGLSFGNDDFSLESLDPLRH